MEKNDLVVRLIMVLIGLFITSLYCAKRQRGNGAKYEDTLRRRENYISESG